MKTLETERLILRKFAPDDLPAVQSYTSCPDTVTYMVWGPNTEDDTRAFINMAIRNAEQEPCRDYQYAAVFKDTGTLIGACNLHINDEQTAEIGWILHPNHWNKGYGFEMGKRLLELGFDELSFHRIIAVCDAENIGSYRLMEKLGMRREGLFFDVRPANKKAEREYSDELLYAMLKSDWETAKEIAYYNALPFAFNGFIDVPSLTNGDIYLVCTNKKPGDPEKNWIPGYEFAVCKNSEQIGHIGLRIGYGGGQKNDNLYYGGQIGYGINEAHRGKGYAVEACKLLLPIAKAHKMTKLLITNNYTNIASRRVCEKLSAKHVGKMVRLPDWNDMYKEGQRFINIFEWHIE